MYGSKRRWLNYRAVPKDGRVTKIPFSPITKKNASSMNESDWGDYSQALAHNSKAIGIVFTQDRLLLGVDLDKILKGDEIIGEKKELIAQFIIEANSYCEISPSGTGLHILFELSEPLDLIANRHENFEAYTCGRYFTFTGNVYKTNNNFRKITSEEALELLSILKYPWGKESKGDNSSIENSSNAVAITMDDETLLKKMFSSKHGRKIKALYEGDISEHDGDISSADMALLLHLAFWTCKNPTQMECLWLASSLGAREKTQKRKDYRDRTIKNAILKCTEVYKQNKRKINTSELLKTTQRNFTRNRLEEVRAKDDKEKAYDYQMLSVYASIFLEKNINLKVTLQGEFYDYGNGVYRPQTDRIMKNRIYQSLDDEGLSYIASPSSVSKIVNQLIATAPQMPESDTDAFILNLKNGLLDLRSMALLPHTPEYVSTSQSVASYIPKAECKRWKAFLDDVTKSNPELISYLQEVVGYCALTNDTSHHAAFFIYGPGGNGKGTFTRIIVCLLDPEVVYYASVGQITGRFGGSMMIDKRLVIVDEPSMKEFQSEVFRKYVSGEPCVAEKKGVSEMIPFTPRARFIITTNEIPRYDEANNANARRFHIIPFTTKFDDKKLVLGLADLIIKEELDGILLWAVDGLKRLQERGKFTRPEIVLKEQKNLARNNSSVRAFFDENFSVSCVPSLCVKFQKDEMYALYRAFCDRNGYHPKASPRFVGDMKLMQGIDYKMNDDRVVEFTNLMPLDSLKELKEFAEERRYMVPNRKEVNF